MKLMSLVSVGLCLSVSALAGGRAFKVPSVGLRQRLNWGSQLEVPGGPSLAFGGHHGDAPDGRPHTRVREGAAWKRIDADLRKANQLQKYHDRVRTLRDLLKHMLARARHIYLEGRSGAEEQAFLAEKVHPGLKKCAADLAALVKELEGLTGLGEYEAGQVKFALSRLAKVAPAAGVITGRVEPVRLKALREAQIGLELAAEAFGAEPPPRVMSPLVYDRKTRLFLVFGGDHFDYLTNDLWVFDPAKKRWFQRHPKVAPEPRGGHKIEAGGDGRLSVRGGYTYSNQTGRGSSQYVHVGGGAWVYDIGANAWNGRGGAGKTFPAHARVYRRGPYLPEHFTEGPRPDAAANEKKLAALPANTWVRMNPPRKWVRNRDWGTVALDAGRDMIYVYNGGHSAYTATDVAHYHISTDRWEQPVPTEEPLGAIGGSGSSVPGVSFNLRPWITNHTWNCYEHHPGLEKMVLAGRGGSDRYTYLYDPDRGDWASRHPIKSGMSNDRMYVNLLWAPDRGMLSWTRNGLWMLDEKSLDWRKLKHSGRLVSPQVDASGLIYDSKRKRVLFFRKGWGKPYTGGGAVLDLKSMKVSGLAATGGGSDALRLVGKFNRSWFVREVIYHPGSDMVIFYSNLLGGYMPALDVARNRWVGLKIPGAGPGINVGMVYDARRDLVWAVDNHANVKALRLDPKTLEMTAFKDVKLRE
jgi:hypothetical protein